MDSLEPGDIQRTAKPRNPGRPGEKPAQPICEERRIAVDSEGTGGTQGTATAGGASGGSLANLAEGTGGTHPGGLLGIKSVIDQAEKPKQNGKPKDTARRTAANSEGTGGTEGTAKAGGASGGSLANPAEGTEGTQSVEAAAEDTGQARVVVDLSARRKRINGRLPAENDADELARPYYAVREDWSQYGPPGVWYHGHKSGGKDKDPEPLNLWLCSPLKVVAVTCTDDGRNFGRWLEFLDTFGNRRTWASPKEMLRGSCEELRGELLAAGVHIDHRERARLADYLQWKTPQRRVTAALRTGWTRDGQAFVLPDKVIGSEDVIFQSETMHQDGMAETGGDFATWQADIAARCVGNPVLALSVCVSLAGPLLAKVQRDSGGVHWVGDSSTGKTTALNVGASLVVRGNLPAHLAGDRQRPGRHSGGAERHLPVSGRNQRGRPQRDWRHCRSAGQEQAKRGPAAPVPPATSSAGGWPCFRPVSAPCRRRWPRAASSPRPGGCGHPGGAGVWRVRRAARVCRGAGAGRPP